MGVLAVMRPAADQNAASLSVSACVETVNGRVLDTDRACLEKLFATAWEAGELEGITLEADEYETGSGTFEDACHVATHEVGRRMARSTSEPAAYVASVPVGLGNRCTAGLVHGLFDEMSLGGHADDLWSDLAAACNAVMERALQQGVADNGCSEGMGHMAWNTQADPGKGSLLCVELKRQFSAVTCVLSVFMEMYFPRKEFRVHATPALPEPEEWSSLCRDLGEAHPYVGMGCAAGAGYVWLRTPPRDSRLDVVFDRNKETSSRVTEALSLISEMDRDCGRFGVGEEYGACMMQNAALPWDIQSEPTVAERLCEGAVGMLEIYCSRRSTETGGDQSPANS